jgi:hypothetical protein
MKYLSDTEILNWNRRLEKSDYSVYPLSNYRSGRPDIIFRQKVSGVGGGFVVNYPTGEQLVETIDPFIRYDFTFSIASNRKEVFFDLFEKLSKEAFDTKSTYRPPTMRDDKDIKVFDIPFNDKVIESKEEDTHMVFEKEYIRYTYHFAGKLGSIMAYVSYLEDAINFFSEIWGYNEDGSEVCLLKYPIGTIVSLHKDKSTDYLVLEYKYRKLDGKYSIDFIASEMLNNKGTIITYGEIYTFRESELCYSRNSRIDDILN